SHVCMPTCALRTLLNCSGHHRALHSFPSRRSSDLPARLYRVGIEHRQHRLRLHAEERIADTPISRDLLQELDRPAGKFPTIGGRSEEHTSELQSRENLVCRLLLEKKNDDARTSP